MIIAVAFLIIGEYNFRLQLRLLADHLLLVQGWSSVIPHFSTVDFFSMYLEIFVMISMFILYMLICPARSGYCEVMFCIHFSSGAMRRPS